MADSHEKVELTWQERRSRREAIARGHCPARWVESENWDCFDQTAPAPLCKLGTVSKACIWCGHPQTALDRVVAAVTCNCDQPGPIECEQHGPRE